MGVVNIAVCVMLLITAVPRILAPSKNVTIPLGKPLVALTVAVKVTVSPAAVGFNDATNLVVVGMGLTVSFKAVDTLGLNPLIPL